ncbi:MAG: bifunctional oligoribonuclease/PAP phosphatase NrnA [Candidatus Aminicenantales bacterium]
MKKDPVDQISQEIRRARRIVITSHLRPDGDSICTGLALYLMGELLGKEMAIINRDRTPFPFNHYPDADLITIGQIAPRGFDLIILLECANVSRSGQDRIDGYFKINIDHHHSNDYFADINWVEPDAPAVAEMAFRLGKKLGVPWTSRIATHLYCGIVSDTGSFQFSNTNAEAFRACYELVTLGADPIQVSEFLFNNSSPEKIKLLGRVLSTLQMDETGEIAVITMFRTFLDSVRLKEVDTEDITTLARSIKGVKMVLFFKEISQNTFRVSLRSKGSANAAKVAEYFEGGGHRHAAGFTVSGEYEELITTIPRKVYALLHQSGTHPDDRDSGSSGQ